jgi:hypothetical protein
MASIGHCGDLRDTNSSIQKRLLIGTYFHFFMDWSWPDAWDGLRAWLEGVIPGLPERPKAPAIESAHWEADPVRVTTMTSPQIRP